MEHNKRNVSLDVDLKGLHRCNKLGEGGDIDTAENLEVQKGCTLESMVLIAYIGIFTETERSILSWDV